MEFHVVQKGILKIKKQIDPPDGRQIVYLEKDDAGDPRKYHTQYFVSYSNAPNKIRKLGSIRIGEKGLMHGSPDIPKTFVKLRERFFSVGQSREYYEGLMGLEDREREAILVGLRDIVKDESIALKYKDEKVLKEALFGDFSVSLASGQFRRILKGRKTLTAFRFQFKRPRNPGAKLVPTLLDFSVEPESNPPTNVHALIGRNGVGKTDILRRMALSILGTKGKRSGRFTYANESKSNLSKNGPKDVFANLVVVAFSVFDPFSSIIKEETASINYFYIGLKSRSKVPGDDADGGGPGPRDPIDLMRESFPEEFAEAIERCQDNNSLPRLRRAFEVLGSDGILASWDFPGMAENISSIGGRKRIIDSFSDLSSGHKIVCLTIAKLVAFVAEQSIVLLDEPESHLHPPLLSAFIRAISELLIAQNGVAVIATHSPVVLQEVPKECVWILDRRGLEAKAERPVSETFGENVGSLTRDVFQLEVRESGFNKLIEDAALHHDSYDEVVSDFNEKLGSEARVILRSLFESRKPKK